MVLFSPHSLKFNLDTRHVHMNKFLLELIAAIAIGLQCFIMM